jgi:hypothetical protein
MPPAGFVSSVYHSLSEASGVLTSSLKRRKERIINLLGTINPQTINAILRGQPRDPSLERVQYI